MTITEYKELCKKDVLRIGQDVKETVKTLDYQELVSLVTGYIHEDYQKTYDDIGQTAVFESMSAWNSDIFDEIAEEYDLELEEAE